jgi:hypothetical protein
MRYHLPIALASWLVVGEGMPARAQTGYEMFSGMPGTSPVPSGTLPALSRQLFAEAQQLVPAVRYELAGTVQGQRSEMVANALIGAAQALDFAIGSGTVDPGRTLPALASVDQAFSRLQAELNNPPGTAPQSAWIVRRIDRLVFELRRAMPGIGPSFGSQPGLPPGPAQIEQLADSLEANLGFLINSIRSDPGLTYAFDRLARDLESVAAQVVQFHDLVRRGGALGQLQAADLAIRNQVRQIGVVMEGAGPPVRVLQVWRAVAATSDQLGDALGLSRDYLIDPNQPVIINRPAYGQLPWTIVPTTSAPPTGALVPLIDQALGETNGFLAALLPNLLRIPEGPGFQADARALIGDLLGFRQAIASGALGPPLFEAARRVDATYRRLLDRTNRIARGQVGPNIARVYRIGTVIDQIRGSLPRF